MPTPASTALSATFLALSDPTRRAILSRLTKGDAVASELARPFSISAPAISRHLRVLADAGLVERRVKSRWRIYRLRAPGLRAANDWLARYQQFWEDSLDRLVDYVERPSVPGDPGRTEQKRPARPRRASNSSTTRRSRS